jgi:solute:Na+ symporter, SSS family
VVFPTVESIQEAFPQVGDAILGHDLAYPAMLTFLPSGLLGLVVASLAAAYMSTMSTHLNWGSSYVVHDFWRRFVDPDAGERASVTVGRVTTVLLMVLAAVLALWLRNALQAFQILLQIGAGTGLLFILRWFWWRINAFSEITAMVVSFMVAFWLELVQPRLYPGLDPSPSLKLVIGVAITTAAWVVVTLVVRPTATATLRSFYRTARPGGPGWTAVARRAAADGEPLPTDPADDWTVPEGIVAMTAGVLAVYAALFATGYWIYGRYALAAGLGVVAVGAAVALARIWGRVAGRG